MFIWRVDMPLGVLLSYRRLIVFSSNLSMTDFQVLLIRNALAAHCIVDILGLDSCRQSTERALAKEKIDLLK